MENKLALMPPPRAARALRVIAKCGVPTLPPVPVSNSGPSIRSRILNYLSSRQGGERVHDPHRRTSTDAR